MNDILLGLLGLTFFWTLWNFFWKDYAIDSFREKLFSIRNEFFLMALHKESGLNFDSDVYQNFELLLNTTIRYGHRLSLLNGFIFKLINWLSFSTVKVETIFNYRFRNSIEELKNKNPSLHKEMTLLKAKYEMAVIKYFLSTSILFFILITSVSIVQIVKVFIVSVYKFFHSLYTRTLVNIVLYVLIKEILKTVVDEAKKEAMKTSSTILDDFEKQVEFRAA